MFWVEAERREEFAATSDLHRSIWCWRRSVEDVREAATRLPSARFLQLRYESIAWNSAAMANRVASYLGFVDEHSKARLTDAFAQFRAESIGRWSRELGTDERELLERGAGSLLRRLGYSEACNFANNAS